MESATGLGSRSIVSYLPKKDFRSKSSARWLFLIFSLFRLLLVVEKFFSRVKEKCIEKTFIQDSKTAVTVLPTVLPRLEISSVAKVLAQ